MSAFSSSATSSMLSVEQQYAFDKFVDGHNLFITGPGGTGKTKLIQHLVDYANVKKQNIQVCALTGCASLLLGCNARTIHSWSGIKIARGTIDEIVSQVLRNKRIKKNWTSVRILVVDEVSMMSKKIFDCLEKIARTIRRNSLPFGGIQVVFTGDFFQLPPVPTISEPETAEFCFESSLWRTVFSIDHHIELKTMFRQSDPKYIEILAQIRRGDISSKNIEILHGYVKREYLPEEHNGSQLVKLFPVKSRAEYVNRMMFDKIQESMHTYSVKKRRDCTTYLDSDKAIESEKMYICNSLSITEIESEFENLINNIPCSTELELKRGTAVMCCVNMDMNRGICNGSQGIIMDFIGENKVPMVKFSNGVCITVPIHYWQSESYPSIAIGQYPLCLAWALTIHKIQGATMDMAQIDIGQNIFEYGQTYVALSRIKSLDGLYLSSFHPLRIKADPKVVRFYAGLKDVGELIALNSNSNSIEKKEPESIKKVSISTGLGLDFEKYSYLPGIPITIPTLESKFTVIKS